MRRPQPAQRYERPCSLTHPRPLLRQCNRLLPLSGRRQPHSPPLPFTERRPAPGQAGGETLQPGHEQPVDRGRRHRRTRSARNPGLGRPGTSPKPANQRYQRYRCKLHPALHLRLPVCVQTAHCSYTLQTTHCSSPPPPPCVCKLCIIHKRCVLQTTASPSLH